ncbi:hypothetical protein J9332_37680, partial [Aquimarina celericrescens]|nr:hypothetical protein [Aquimarina celericrescens]
ASGSKGKSGSNEMQLPDIIKKQEELNEQMKEGSKKGEKQGNKEEEKNSGEDKEGDQKGNKKNGKQKGGEGNNEEGESEQQKEDLNGQLYEIYKEQQQLRNALQDKINKEGKGNSAGSGLLKKMEQVE